LGFKRLFRLSVIEEVFLENFTYGRGLQDLIHAEAQFPGVTGGLCSGTCGVAGTGEIPPLGRVAAKSPPFDKGVTAFVSTGIFAGALESLREGGRGD
jgi:hypothetical protein